MKKFLMILSLLLLPLQNVSAETWEDYLGTVRMEAKYVNPDLIELNVYVEEMIKPVLGMAFHLNYDAEKLDFLRYEPGEFMEKGGDPIYLVSNHSDGKLVFGETLKRNDSFPVGTGKLVKIYFEIEDGDQFEFVFQHGVVSTLEEVRQDIDLIDWQDLKVDQQKQISKSQNEELGFLTASTMSIDIEGDKSFWLGYWTIASVSILITVVLAWATYRLIKRSQDKRAD